MGLLLALLLADLTVPPTTTLVRYGSGLVLFQEQVDGGDVVRVLNRKGELLRVLRPAGTLPRSRMHDMSVVDSGTVAVSVSTPGTLGPSVQEIIVYRAAGEPVTVNTSRTVCYLLAPDGEDGFWCLGPTLGAEHRARYDALTRWNQRGEKIGSYVPRSWFPTGEGDPEPYQLGEMGPPQLLDAGRGLLLAWLPAGNLMVNIDASRGQVDRRVFSFRRAGRSTVSFAAGAAGVRYALLPAGGGEETFLTAYRLHEAPPGDPAWKPSRGVAPFPRSSYLLGVDGGAVVVWVRPERKVRWIAIQ